MCSLSINRYSGNSKYQTYSLATTMEAAYGLSNENRHDCKIVTDNTNLSTHFLNLDLFFQNFKFLLFDREVWRYIQVYYDGIRCQAKTVSSLETSNNLNPSEEFF